MPFRQQDWPLQPLPPPPPNLSFVGWYNQNLVSKDQLPARQQDWPVPRGAQLGDQSFIRPANLNLLAKTLPLTTFSQYDWPLQARGPAQPDRTWAGSYNQNLIGQDQLPFRQLDWPLPQIAPWPYKASLERQVYLTFDFIDTFYGAPGQVPQHDYPLPPQAPSLNLSYVWPSPMETLYSPATTPLGQPFNQHVWPTPQVRWLWR